jgi:hypothetical protein
VAAVVVLLALALAAPATARTRTAARLEIGSEAGTGDGVLRLMWADAVRTRPGQDGREVTLRFSRPLGDAPVDSIPARLPGLVENAVQGYDSLLLVLAPGVTAGVAVESQGVQVRLTRAPAAGTPPPDAATTAAPAVAGRRLDQLRAVVLMEEGNTREARRLLGELVERDPRDGQAVALLAAAEERLGRWREAARLYALAAVLMPAEPGPPRDSARLRHDYGPFVRVESEIFQVRRADTQRVRRLSGRADVGDGARDGAGATAAELLVENRDVSIDRSIRRDGQLRPFHGQRTRVEIAALHDLDNGDRARLALFAGPDTLGAGYVHALRWDRGETSLGVLWHEPVFTFVEAITGGGRRDRLFVRHEQSLGERWGAMLGASINRYGLSGAGDLARSAGVEAALRFTLTQPAPVLALVYGIDGEYVGRRSTVIDPAGVAVAPLPLVTREVHSLTLAVEEPLTDTVRLAGQAGYAWDRFNKGGPFAALSLAWEPVRDLELALRASHTLSTARGTGDRVDALGGTLTLRY